ncbi:MAG: ATP-binding protein [Lachnospiraceae bacterium]
MALSNSEYNLIMREYEERRYKAKHDLDRRVKEIYEKIPRIKEIQDEISTAAVESMKSRLYGMNRENGLEGQELHNKIEALVEEKETLMKEHGYSPQYLKPRYVCEICKDTGYVGNEKCRCLRSRMTELLYLRSNLKEVLEKENFDTFNIDLYSESFVDKVMGVSAYDNIKEVLKRCRAFTYDFPERFENLFIYGDTGVGKTFLTNCIAKEIMDKSYSVIYVSAIRMFEILSDRQFGKGESDGKESREDFRDCDLLIIDDLGTELVNTFTSSSLFNCINERLLMRKPVIISTNLSINNVKSIYSERIFSRIASNYTMLKVFGEDLRIVTSLGLTKA